MPKTRTNTTMTDKQKKTVEKINQEAEKVNLNVSCMKTNYIQGSLNGENPAPEQFPDYSYPIRFYCVCCETPMKSEAELKKHIVREKHKNERNKRDYVSQLELENQSLRKKLLKYECASIGDYIRDNCGECDFIYVASHIDYQGDKKEIYCRCAPTDFHEFFFHYKNWCKSLGSKYPDKETTKKYIMNWQEKSHWGLDITEHNTSERFFKRNGSYKNFLINLKPTKIMKEYNSELDETI